jgi:hypothetical protein
LIVAPNPLGARSIIEKTNPPGLDRLDTTRDFSKIAQIVRDRIGSIGWDRFDRGSRT